MTEQTQSQRMSRRKVLSLLGLAALAVPSTVVTLSDAEAQTGTQTAPTVGQASPPLDAQQTGTERRQGRRTRRVKRRVERRETRKKGRAERRELRRGD